MSRESHSPHDAGSPADRALTLVRKGWREVQLQRPLAAWADWQQALRLAPDDEAARQAMVVLETATDLPLAARLTYRFRTPDGEARRRRWDEILRSADLASLDEAAGAFAAIAEADPDDSAAHYNHALALAWLGENAPAIVALAHSVALDAGPFPDLAADAWTLAEILRQGAGAEAMADDLDRAVTIAWDDAEAPASLDPAGEIRPLPAPIDPATGAPIAGARAYEWLDRPNPAPSGELSPADLPRLLASLIQRPGTLRISTPVPPVGDPLASRLPDGIIWEATPLPLRLLDAAIWTFRLPQGLDDPTRRRLAREIVEQYYENDWIHIPRQGLRDLSVEFDAALIDSRTPLEVAKLAAKGDATARVQLSAVIALREQLGFRPRTAPLYAGYPFDRLRRRLGLEPNDPMTIDADDPACMSPTELSRLDPASLSPAAKADARASALGLRDAKLARRFAP